MRSPRSWVSAPKAHSPIATPRNRSRSSANRARTLLVLEIRPPLFHHGPMQKRPLRLVSRRSAAATQKIDEMQPGDLLYRLAVLSPDDYRAFIALLRWRYKQ